MTIILFQLGGSETAVETTPSDDDADVTVTTRADCDGATVRPPRVTLLTAVDSLANSALADPQRGALDAHEVRFIRLGNDETGTLYRVYGYSNRGADAFAAKAIVIEYEVLDNTADMAAADTTSGTDRDGAHVRVPQLALRTAMNSLRNGALTIASGTDRDAREARFMCADVLDVGYAIRLLLDQAGRGGDAYAVTQVKIDYDVIPPGGVTMTGEY